MEKSLKGTRTEQNLLKAFAGESQTRNRYEFFAKAAKDEGYQQISGIFQKTADQEKQHARHFFNFLEGGDVKITATFQAGKIGSTVENLEAAARGEYEEWSVLYPEYSEIAKAEGFGEIVVAFKMISRVEAEHERRFRKLIKNLEQGTVFQREGTVRWVCSNCGYVHEGPNALDKCPACFRPRAFFEIEEENY
ncbi:MAG TPA: rubrerythrin family protein [Bacteroidales bacterium]